MVLHHAYAVGQEREAGERAMIVQKKFFKYARRLPYGVRMTLEGKHLTTGYMPGPRWLHLFYSTGIVAWSPL